MPQSHKAPSSAGPISRRERLEDLELSNVCADYWSQAAVERVVGQAALLLQLV